MFENVNNILGVRIQSETGTDLICIFKPADGENKSLKKREGLPPEFKFYPRECAGYLVSDHFDLDIVPPTVIREVDNEIGALQLFLSPKYYKNFSQADLQEMNQIRETEDWQKIAILDWLLINNDRHSDNMMTDRQKQGALVAIDHGIILDGSYYQYHTIYGPSRLLTQKNEKPVENEIPENLLNLLEKGLKDKSSLNGELEKIGSIDDEELEHMWLRAEQLVDSKKFLSRVNFEEIFGYSWRAYDRYEEENR